MESIDSILVVSHLLGNKLFQLHVI
jgi:hypothetical protein